MSAPKASNWEGLRKQARALENEIDLKLVTFSKLGTSYSRAGESSDRQPLLATSQAESDWQSVQGQLEQQLVQLANINEEMASYAAGAGEGRSAAIHHTLQRHTEILQDYRQEFNKTSSNIAAIVEREDLLSSVQSGTSHEYRTRQNNQISLAILKTSCRYI